MGWSGGDGGRWGIERMRECRGLEMGTGKWGIVFDLIRTHQLMYPLQKTGYKHGHSKKLGGG